MSLLMTNERCPECSQIIYMLLHPKCKADTYDPVTFVIEGEKLPHIILDGVYADKDEALVVTRFDEWTHMPEYYCIHCGWRV